MLNNESVKTGAKAIKRLQKSWEQDWLPIGEGLMALRREAMSKGQPGSKPYNELFGQLIEKNGYGSRDLEKNTRVDLLKLMTHADALEELNRITKGWTPAERAALNPRAAWKLVKPPAGGAQKEKESTESPPVEKKTTNNELEARLADALDLLSRAINLDGDIETRVAELWKDKTLQPKLLTVEAAIASQMKAKPVKKTPKVKGNGKSKTDDAQPF